MVAQNRKRLSPEQFGQLIGKSRESVVRLIRCGEIAATDERMPGASIPLYRIDPAEADRWRRARAVMPESQEAVEPKLTAPRPGQGSFARRREERRRKRAAGSARD